jgi:hypothetical protein
MDFAQISIGTTAPVVDEGCGAGSPNSVGTVQRLPAREGLAWYVGPTQAMPPGLRAAVTDLMTRRYAEQIAHLHETLQSVSADPPSSPAFALEYAQRFRRLYDEIYEADAQQTMFVMYVMGPDGGQHPVASMRTVRGARADATINRTVGDPASTIPCHQLLRFSYPTHADFDPRCIVEADLTEVKRLVSVTQPELQSLLHRQVIGTPLATYLMHHAVDELINALWETGRDRADRPLAYLFLTHPRLAYYVGANKHIPMRPAFEAGVEPTAQTTDRRVLGGHYARWRHVLSHLVPATVAEQGIAAATRYLYEAGPTTWKRCPLLLPFVLVDNAHISRSMHELRSRMQRTWRSLQR